MQRHDIDAPHQTYTSTPCLAALIATQTRMHARRARKGPALAARLVLGTGVVVLLALLSAWALPHRQDTAMDATAIELAHSQTLAPYVLEDAGLAAWTVDDFFTQF